MPGRAEPLNTTSPVSVSVSGRFRLNFGILVSSSGALNRHQTVTPNQILEENSLLLRSYRCVPWCSALLLLSEKTRMVPAVAYRVHLEVIMIDLALRFTQDGLKVAWRGQLGEPLAITFLVR
jgi:hypothetical protein